MKFPFTASIAGLTVFALCEVTSGTSPTHEPLTQFESLGSSSYRLDWNGAYGWTYFVQVSGDLSSWSYCPEMFYGENHKPLELTTTNSRVFFRLSYVDEPTTDPENDDYDGDGIPNLFEIEELGTDPLDGTSNGGDSEPDGLSDGWEIYHFGAITAYDGTDDPDGDGISNADELAGGTDPNSYDAPPTNHLKLVVHSQLR